VRSPGSFLPRLLVSITERQEIEAAIEQAEDSEDEETTEAHYQRLDAFEEKEEELKERLQVPDPAQVALAGALVTIDRNGKLRIERGLLKPGDAKKAASTPRSKAKAARAAFGHSTPLLRRRASDARAPGDSRTAGGHRACRHHAPTHAADFLSIRSLCWKSTEDQSRRPSGSETSLVPGSGSLDSRGSLSQSIS
jgi:hypothetical protein